MHATTADPPTRRRRSLPDAFTLIELVVVVVIVAVLVGLSAVGYTSVIANSRNKATEVSLRQMHKTAMAAAVAEQRSVTLADFQSAANQTPSLVALSGQTAVGLPQAAGNVTVQAGSDSTVSKGVVAVSIDPSDPGIVGLATRASTGACVTLAGVTLSAETEVGASTCTGNAALATANTKASTPTSTTTTPASTTTTTASPTSSPTTTTASPTTTTPPGPPPPDNLAWTTQTSGLEGKFWYGMEYGASSFVAVGSGNTATSADGLSWTVKTSPAPLMSVAYGNGLFVAPTNTATTYYTSTDGSTWTQRTLASGLGTNMKFLNGRFVSTRGTTTGGAWSTDGLTWTTFTLPFTNLTKLSYGNGVYVALNAGGTTQMATSPDLVTWTARTAPTTDNSGIAFGAGQFV